MNPRLTHIVPPWHIHRGRMRVEIREDCGRYQLEISDEEMDQDVQPPQLSLTEGEAAQLVEYLAAARTD